MWHREVRTLLKVSDELVLGVDMVYYDIVLEDFDTIILVFDF